MIFYSVYTKISPNSPAQKEDNSSCFLHWIANKLYSLVLVKLFEKHRWRMSYKMWSTFSLQTCGSSKLLCMFNGYLSKQDNRYVKYLFNVLNIKNILEQSLSDPCEQRKSCRIPRTHKGILKCKLISESSGYGVSLKGGDRIFTLGK